MMLLEFPCWERRNLVVRKITEVPVNKQLETYLSAKLASLPRKFWPVQDFSYLYDLAARTFLVDNVGLLLKGPISHDGLPDVHVCFWDKILRGRESLCWYVASQVAKEAQSPGVWTAIPRDARTVLAFARRVGFRVTSVNEDLDLVGLSLLFTPCK